MLHVCFSETVRDLLEQSELQEQNVVCFTPNLSFGKLSFLQEEVSSEVDSAEKLQACKEFSAVLEHHKEITVWYSLSPQEYCGMLYTVWLLEGKKITLYGINCSVDTHSQNKQILSAAQLLPAQLYSSEKNSESAYNNRTLLNKTIRLGLSNVWEKMINENGQHRTLENENIQTVGAAYYDATIYTLIPSKPERIGTVIGNVLAEIAQKEKVEVGEDFVASRINYFIKNGMAKIYSDESIYDEQMICCH